LPHILVGIITQPRLLKRSPALMVTSAIKSWENVVQSWSAPRQCFLPDTIAETNADDLYTLTMLPMVTEKIAELYILIL
jgi:hypothetical protein